MTINKVNAIIEITYGSKIKYELDKKNNKLVVDRILQASMVYPANYGYIDSTLAQDGDPLDVLVLTHYNLIPGCSIEINPIGVIFMEDEKGVDEKILAIPIKKIDKNNDNIHDISDIPQQTVAGIVHFFEHYKDLEENKYVKILKTGNKNDAMEIIKKYTVK